MGLDLWMLCYLLRLLVFGLGVKVSAFGFKLSEFVEVQLFISEPQPETYTPKATLVLLPAFGRCQRKRRPIVAWLPLRGLGRVYLNPQ